MKSLWVIFICVCIILAVITIAWVVFLVHRHYMKTRRRNKRRHKKSIREPTLKQHSKKIVGDIKTISIPKHVNEKGLSETDNPLKQSMKKQVSFGDEEQISYDPPVYGGYAHAAVKVAKRNQGKNKRRTFELILRPDNFHIDLVVENPSGYCTSIYESNPNDDSISIENLAREYTD